MTTGAGEIASGADFRVTIIGCAGTHASSESACSGYLVRSPGATVLYDAGPGTSIELQRHVSLADLDAIVVSHEHPDHWTELPILYHAFRYGQHRRTVPTFSTEGVRDLLDHVAPASREYAFEWTTIHERSELTIGDQRWTFSRTDHPVETLAARVQVGERAVGFSSDTGPAWSPEDFGDPLDLMIYEATLPSALEASGIPHVSGREASERATAAGVGRLVLTHVPPGEDPDVRMAEARPGFEGPIELAVPGRTFDV